MMDDEKKDEYWSNLEKVYVHNVYANISAEFLKIPPLSNSSNTQQNSSIKSIDRQSRPSIDSLNHKNINNNYTAWPKVEKFINNLNDHSLIADIGCGEGKYLNINKNIMTIGCDYSIKLCKLATTNSSNVIVCDNLSLPFKNELFDAVISIGVIHHFSTKKRRIEALKELVRIVKVDGKVMIYVWAMEQRSRKFNAQDILVPMRDQSEPVTQRTKLLYNQNLNVKTNKETADHKSIFSNILKYISSRFNNNNKDDVKSCVNELNDESINSYKDIIEKYKYLLPNDFSLREFPSSSCPDTFKSSTIFKSKDDSTIPKTIDTNEHSTNSTTSNNNNKNLDNKRYYHVFKKDELNSLINDNFPQLKIYHSYYDHGNWCICAQKIKLQ
jgi:ubiquinone/menaquinone biosynthesis C-methylase UbiE